MASPMSVPGVSTTPVWRASKNIMAARESAVNGQTAVAEPANATIDTRSPLIPEMSAASSDLALPSLLGAMSSASMLADTSSAIATSIPWVVPRVRRHPA
jgi:hypothetical protein